MVRCALTQHPEDLGNRFFGIAHRDAIALRVRDHGAQIPDAPPRVLADVDCLEHQVLDHLRLGGGFDRGGAAKVLFKEEDVSHGTWRKMPAPAGVDGVEEPEAPPVGRDEPVQPPAERDETGDDRQNTVEDDELLRERLDIAALEQDDLVGVDIGAPQQQAEQQRRLADPPGARHQHPAAVDRGAPRVQAGGGGMSVEHEVGDQKLQVEDAGVEQREPAVDLPAVPQLEDRARSQQLDLDLPGGLPLGFRADGDLPDPALDLLPVRADADQVVEDAVAAG